jgi:integrase
MADSIEKLPSYAILAPKNPALSTAISTWADATTDRKSRRRGDLLRDKQRAVTEFFDYVGQPPDQVVPRNVKEWQEELESRGLASATVYAMVSRISSFYNWLLRDNEISQLIRSNPVELARPKAPKAYQSDSSKALSDEKLGALIATVKELADEGSIVAKRDYALLVHYMLTGRRREEVIGLRWKDIELADIMVVTYQVKGGARQTRLVRDPAVRSTMLDYLETAGRLAELEGDEPVWTRHDRAGRPGTQLTSHAFVKNLKRYAASAGLKSIHLHQLRHSFARIAGDVSGSIPDVQEALGHRSQATTRIYLERVGVYSDGFSSRVAERLGVE